MAETKKRAVAAAADGYVELHARSAFSFLRGASQPEDLALRAAELGLSAMALCDRDGVPGAPRFFRAARETGVRPIIGSELTMEDGSVLPVLVENRQGYQNLCRLLTRARLRAPKGEGAIGWEELPEFTAGLFALTGDEEGALRRLLARGEREEAIAHLRQLQHVFGADRVHLELQRHCQRGERALHRQLLELATRTGAPLLATGGVLYARREGREVLDVFTCARRHTPLDAAGTALAVNAERHLKSAARMRALFADLPEAVDNTVRLGARLEFTLDDLGYEFPRFPVPAGHTMESFLREVTLAGARHRYRDGFNTQVRAQLERELTLIAQLGFAGYFLIVWDLVKFCAAAGIMVQGRGSAANSAVCYSLEITAVDPIAGKLLFERFLSEGRQGWPDIDLDLPSGERRERVIQEVYRRYGARGAAMTANVITFRSRSAMRELGKALALPADVMDRFSALSAGGDFPETLDTATQLQAAGLPAGHPRGTTFLRLFPRIRGLPRHLGQHSGGMVVCQGQLDSVVPLENASMPGRHVIQWDKNDCEDLGIIKIDLLGLGMMAVLQDTIELSSTRGRPVDWAHLPKDDAETFATMQRADTVGVFQIESRAQMATLPQMRPACFYDVAIEVAIIRPGPIEGGLRHPYLARRQGLEPVTFLDERLRPILERTLGVPLFQEQMLKIAMVMADFSGAEAEELRRAMSFHRSHERMRRVEVKLRAALEKNGVAPTVREEIVHAIGSFALYGFPESHALSFALLAYGSTWMKVHRAAEFYASLLNNQPMGFYSPATLVKDARRHGIRVRPVCVTVSDWRCTVEADDTIRLGLGQVQGLRADVVAELLAERVAQPFRSLDDFRERVCLEQSELRALARLGALNALLSTGGHRRTALWHVEQPVRRREEDLFRWEQERRATAPKNRRRSPPRRRWHPWTPRNGWPRTTGCNVSRPARIRWRSRVRTCRQRSGARPISSPTPAKASASSSPAR